MSVLIPTTLTLDKHCTLENVPQPLCFLAVTQSTVQVQDVRAVTLKHTLSCPRNFTFQFEWLLIPLSAGDELMIVNLRAYNSWMIPPNLKICKF